MTGPLPLRMNNMSLQSNLTLKYITVQNQDGVGIIRVSQIQAPSQWSKATLKAVLDSIIGAEDN